MKVGKSHRSELLVSTFSSVRMPANMRVVCACFYTGSARGTGHTLEGTSLNEYSTANPQLITLTLLCRLGEAVQLNPVRSCAREIGVFAFCWYYTTTSFVVKWAPAGRTGRMNRP